MTAQEDLTGMPTPGPWRLNGPDDFGDYTISPSTELLAVATVVQNGLRPEAETAANAALIVKAVNAYGSTEALRSALAEARRMCWTAVRLGIDDPAFDPEKHALIQQIDAALSGSPAPSTEARIVASHALPVATWDRIASAVVKRVAELPDRSSPDEWPEAMLITGEELHHIIMSEFDTEIG